MPDVYGIEVYNSSGVLVVGKDTRVCRFFASVDITNPGTYTNSRLIGYDAIMFPIPNGATVNYSIDIVYNKTTGTITWTWEPTGTVSGPSGSRLVVGAL